MEPTRHTTVTARLVIETVILIVASAYAAVYLGGRLQETRLWLLAYIPLLLFQALLFQRLYIIGHEASHRKLVPKNLLWNDILGQIMLLPILIPVRIYRQVHMFHHGFNRKDHHTSALDVFVSPWPVTPLVRAFYSVLWYLGVFAGGYFLHSIASVIIFLFVPTRHAVKVSPAFKRWSNRDRIAAWLQLLACGLFVVALGWLLGWQAWRYVWLYPFMAFAWVWSLLVYVFHYQTTLGEHTRYNVRALEQHWLYSWMLLNFNQHASHHMYPNIPWYQLPERKQELPAVFAEKNQNARSYWQAVMQQLRGPTVVYDKDADPTPHLFVRWED
ncbi:MAG: fatty acid desaturase [Trueperaceae bacterium]|nr:fatty acid desaturase [Trueperaceae bacterium]